MFLKSLFLVFVGLCSGTGIAAGTFAFLLVIRVIPRMVQKAKIEHKVIYIENVVFRGLLFGTVLSLFSWKKKWLLAILGRSILTIYGLSAGIFVGCLAVALAEILDTFPIFFRRVRLGGGLRIILLAVALGKMTGAFLYFFLELYHTIPG